MELSNEIHAFSDLVGRPVRDQAGRRLGRIYEARARREADGTILIEELLVGRRALWRRLRGPKAKALGIPWGAVARVGEEGIVVRVPGAFR